MAQMPRRWREGNILTPHDLSGSEMRKWKKRSDRTADVFDAAGVNPMDHYRVSSTSTAILSKLPLLFEETDPIGEMNAAEARG